MYIALYTRRKQSIVIVQTPPVDRLGMRGEMSSKDRFRGGLAVLGRRGMRGGAAVSNTAVSKESALWRRAMGAAAASQRHIDFLGEVKGLWEARLVGSEALRWEAYLRR